MQQPLVSILVPVYNCEPYLDECIFSIINQDYKNLQIVFANDGSTDNSLAILHKYASIDPRIEILTRENKGVATTRNDLLDKIKGSYFLFVDADDWIETNMVSYLLTLIQEHNADIAVCSNIKDIKDQSDISNEIQPQIKEWTQEQTIEKFLFHKELSGSLWNKLIDNRLLHKEPDSSNNIKRFNPNIYYGEDALFVWELIQGLKKMAVSDKELYHYRMNNASLSHTSFGHKKLSANIVWKIITNDAEKKYPDKASIGKARWGMEITQLLLLATLEKHKKDVEVKKLQKIVRNNFISMRTHRITSLKGLIFAWIVSHNYKVATHVAKYHR